MLRGVVFGEQVLPSGRGEAWDPQGWTWTAIVGNRFLGTGILNNPIYIGQVVWNRFRWEKNPETGKRVPRLRPQWDWLVREHPELRIVLRNFGSGSKRNKGRRH